MERYYYVYVLYLENNKFYVGQTKNALNRIEDHFNGNGSEWTRKFKPRLIHEVRPINFDDKHAEDNITEDYMKIYGIKNVRGGTYSQIELPVEFVKILEKKIASQNDECYECGSKDHYYDGCPDRFSNDKTERPENLSMRGKRWSVDEDSKLDEEIEERIDIIQIAANHHRTVAAIKCRLFSRALGLIENGKLTVQQAQEKYYIDDDDKIQQLRFAIPIASML